jgi:hypothetical protein
MNAAGIALPGGRARLFAVKKHYPSIARPTARS